MTRTTTHRLTDIPFETLGCDLPAVFSPQGCRLIATCLANNCNSCIHSSSHMWFSLGFNGWSENWHDSVSLTSVQGHVWQAFHAFNKRHELLWCHVSVFSNKRPLFHTVTFDIMQHYKEHLLSFMEILQISGLSWLIYNWIWKPQEIYQIRSVMKRYYCHAECDHLRYCKFVSCKM